MMIRRSPGNWATKVSIVKSFLGCVNPLTWLFLLVRTLVLPLDRFDERLPPEGRIVEVGSGHGIITQYLVRRCPARTVVGYDPDLRRIPVAERAAVHLSNLEYRDDELTASGAKKIDAVIICGVLYLLDDEACRHILRAVRRCLKDGGVFVFSDVLVSEGRWRFTFHKWRERLFTGVGFTRAQGIYFRTQDEWRDLVVEAGFFRLEPFDAPVPMHSVFNWVCK